MKKVINYGIIYRIDGHNFDHMYFSKKEMLKHYLTLLESRRDISELSCYLWQGVRKPEYKDITDEINKFLVK